MRALPVERARADLGGRPRRRRSPFLVIAIAAAVVGALGGYFGVGIFARLVYEATKCSQ